MDQHGDGLAEIRTFLIADVRGYTLFTQERGDEAAAKLAAKFAQIAREGVEARGGSVTELRGDEALAVFTSPRQALRAAMDLQVRFADETVDDPSLPLAVGIGLDAGEAVPVEGGYRGGALNLAARLCGQAGPGQVLASREVVHLARKVEGLRFVDQGTVSLKGLADPVHVTRVVPEDGEDPAAIFSSVLAPAKPIQPPAARRGLFPHGLRSRRGLAVGVAVLLVAIGIPLALTRGGGPSGLSGIQSDSVGEIDMASNRITDQVRVGTRPGAVVAGLGAVWVANEEAGSVSRIDPETRAVVDTIEVGNDPTAIAVGEGAVWVANSGDGTVSRINPDANKVVATVTAGNGVTGIAVGSGFVWTANTFDGTVSQIDPDSGSIKATINAGANPTTLAADRTVWVTNNTTGTVTRIDARSATFVGSTHVGNGPAAVVVSDGQVWVANQLDGTVSRIDVGSGTVAATVKVGPGPIALAVGGGSVWVANELGGSVSRIDPATNVVTRTIHVGGAPSGLAVNGRSVWVSARGAGGIHRGGSLNLLAGGRAFPDPAVAYDVVSFAVLSVTNDGLVAYRQTGGAAGATVVADLATSVPDPTQGGLTYTFTLRQGIRYSTGQPVTAADVRYSFERFYESGPVHPYFDGIVGGSDCAAEPKTCDLSEGIVTDNASGTVTFHLTEPDPEFLFKIALPFGDLVPVGTPVHTDDDQTVPATGPYMVHSVTKQRVELVRNPHFREWSPAAKPDGYPDQIVIDIDEDRDHQDARLSQIEQGKADGYINLVAPKHVQELMTRYTSQLHINSLVAVHYLFMDVTRPPFDDVRVRQAIDYAIDRSKVVDAFGGPLSVRPTCQVIPPNFQGYRPYCPYTLNPDESGRWTAPDLAKAKELVRSSGTAGMKLDLAYPAFFPRAAGKYMVSMLRELGYRATLNVSHGADGDFQEYFDYISISSHHVQIGFIGWISDYPVASQFIYELLSCGRFIPNSNRNQNYGQFCDPALDAQMKQALSLQQSDQSAAGQLWAKLDHDLVDQAAIVPIFNRQSVDFVSKRVGNYQYNPLFGMLISQLWVR